MNLTLIDDEQVVGKNKLDIFKKYGSGSMISDFAICLGGIVENDCHIKDENNIKNYVGQYFSKTPCNTSIYVIYPYDLVMKQLPYVRNYGGRPVSSISYILPFIDKIKSYRTYDDILQIEFGYYPQSAVSLSLQNELESNLKNGNLIKTGNTYSTDSNDATDYENDFEEKKNIEYEYKGNRYVRVETNLYYKNKSFVLSNGETYKNRDAVWIKVEPIKWLIDEKTGIMVTEKILFSGVHICSNPFYVQQFEKTDMYKFLNTYFIKDIVQNMNYDLNNENGLESKILKKKI